MDYAQLKRPFDAKYVKVRDMGRGRKESYVNHAVVTNRLNEAAEGWEFRIVEVVVNPETHDIDAVIVEMAVDGVRRQEVGEPKSGTYAFQLKTAVSDGLKRAAMRFGAGIEMWAAVEDDEGGTPAVESALGPASTATDRMQVVIDIGGDTKAVPRAKRLLREYAETDDFGKLSAAQWESFLAHFIETESASA